MIFYNGTAETKTLEVTVSEENQMQMITQDGAKIHFGSSFFTMGNSHARYYNLGLLSYGFDSSREIAIDIIKNQIETAIKQHAIFDTDVNVLLVERIEKELKKLRNTVRIERNKRGISLYSSSVSEVINKVKGLGVPALVM